MAQQRNEGYNPLNGPYAERYKQEMNAFQEGLWDHLEVVPTLQLQTRDAVVQLLLEWACQAQNINRILLGRMALWALPREWLVDYIEHYAEALLELHDEWEYRRLGEVYE